MVRKIYLKELKDIFRDRKTLFLSVIIPVIMISALTLFYENMFFKSEDQIEVYEIGVDDALDTALYQHLDAHPSLKLISTADPLQAAVDGRVRASLIVDADQAVGDGQVGAVSMTILADQSSMRSSYAVSMLMSVIDQYQQEIMVNRLNELGLAAAQITPFDITVESLSGENESSLLLLSILFPLIIVMSVMLGGFSAATDLFAGEKERKTMEALLMTPVSRMKLILAKWLTISTLGVISGVFSILAFVLVTLTVTEQLAQALNFGSQAWLLFVSAVVGIAAFSFMFATIQMIMSIVAKTFKEAQNYLSPIMFLAIVPYFLLIGLIPNELTLKHFTIPFMNIFALLKELLYGIFSLQSMLLVAGSSSLVIVCGFALANWMFSKDKWVLGK